MENTRKSQKSKISGNLEKSKIFQSNQRFFVSQKPKVSEKSLFVEFMGDSPMIKIMDYLITERELDFSITDMAENAGIGRATLYRIWEKLIKNKIIVHTRIIGKAKLFKLNENNLKIKKLVEIYDMLVVDSLRKHSKKKVEVSV